MSDRATPSSRVDVLSMLLIALAAVLTAWSAFESSKWGGVMAIRFNEAGAARTESVRQSNLANRQLMIDVNLFGSFAAAIAQDDDQLAQFLRERFPDRLAVAVDAWIDTDPLVAPDAPASPFDMDQYQLEANEEAGQLEALADQRSDQARQANQRGDNYTITTVGLATVILLAALSAKAEGARLQRFLLGGACALFLATTVIIATFPVEI